jgi:hypothetical protein
MAPRLFLSLGRISEYIREKWLKAQTRFTELDGAE